MVLRLMQQSGLKLYVGIYKREEPCRNSVKLKKKHKIHEIYQVKSSKWMSAWRYGTKLNNYYRTHLNNGCRTLQSRGETSSVPFPAAYYNLNSHISQMFYFYSYSKHRKYVHIPWKQPTRILLNCEFITFLLQLGKLKSVNPSLWVHRFVSRAES
jgi:hypothetical protein